jgi:excisionase family DNA binding protein
MTEKLLLTPVEAANALSIGRSRLYELLGQNVIRSVTIGKSRRVPAEALSEYVRRLEAELDAAS